MKYRFIKTQIIYKTLFFLMITNIMSVCVCELIFADSFGLKTQRDIAMDTPLNRVQILSAHNAWNDSNNAWANQRWPLQELLNSGIRGFDYDLHLDDGEVKFCHGDCGTLYSADDSYIDEMKELAAWVKVHPKEIIFIDLEDRAHTQEGVESPLYQFFGDLLYKPSDKPTDRWETPREMIARGKRVIVKSANDTYDGSLIWDGKIFSVNAGSGWNYRQVMYFDADNCTSDGKPINQDDIYGFMDSKLGKWFLPDDWVDQTGTIDTENIIQMLKCGVNFIDADRWDVEMIDAAVWTWNNGEPNNSGNDEDCASIALNNGRWNDSKCSQNLPYACQNNNNIDDWKITKNAGPWENGFDQCNIEYPGYSFNVPGNAYQNRMIEQAGSVDWVWIAYSDIQREGYWKKGIEDDGEDWITIFEEDFETPDIRTHGWSGDLNDEDRWNTGERYAHSGTYSAFFDCYNSGDQGDMLSPQIDLSKTVNNELSFWVRSPLRTWIGHDYYNHLYIYISNDNGLTFKEIDHLTKIEEYTLKTYNLDSYISLTDKVRILFKGQGGNIDEWEKDTYVDEVKIIGIYDHCPENPDKTQPGNCGCNVADTDSDNDTIADCNDGCPNDSNKSDPGACGCGKDDIDTDNDRVADCNDECPNDPNKIKPGISGCGQIDPPQVSEVSLNGNEDTELNFSSLGFPPCFYDNYGNEFDQIKITALPDSNTGILMLNEKKVTLDETILHEDFSKLIFKPVANWDGNTSFSFKGFNGELWSVESAKINIVIKPDNNPLDNLKFDINNDGKTGLEELIHLLQLLSNY